MEKIKINVSLSLKITLIVIILSALTVATVAYVNLLHQEKEFADSYYQKGYALVQAFNNTIQTETNINNLDFVEEKINFMINHEDNKEVNKIKKINVNFYDLEEDRLYIYASSENNTKGQLSHDYYIGKKHCNLDCYEHSDVFYILDKQDDHANIIVLYPINFGNENLGTYEMIISVDDAYNNLQIRIQNLTMISAISLFAIIFVSLFFLRKAVVVPITKFRESAKIIGKGNLDTKVDIRSRDELGDLANAFNQMAKDLKESRDKIQQYNKILENLIKQKDEFIGQLGHDLKNPLQPLVGLLPMLIEQEKDPKIKEALEIMNKNVEYMRDLIFKTLQLAKLRSSDIKFDMEKINLKENSDSVIESQKLTLKEHKIKVENQIKDDIFVNADKLRLSELFKNLINNSVKYTEKNGRITLNAKIEKDDVIVSIADTGIGMNKEQLDRVFDEFYKANKFSNEYDSSGLGLAICKRIVERHEGKIWVESQGPNKGTTFYFTLKKSNEK